MDDTSIGRQVGDLQASLQAIESELSNRGAAPSGLMEFKSAIDDVRSILIAIITATHSRDYEESIRHFRASRALGLCQNLLADVVDGTVAADTEGFDECNAIVTAILEQVGAEPVA